MEPSWGHVCSPFFGGDADRNPSLSSNLGNKNTNSLGNNLGEDRQVSSWRFLTAWEETRSEAQKLTQNPHFAKLRAEVDNLKECIGHLVRLIDSFHKESPVQNLHVGKQACIDKLVQTDGAEQDPTTPCSLTSCKQGGEHHRVDVTQNKQEQLEQQKQQQQEEETSKQQRPKQHNKQQLRNTANQQLRTRKPRTTKKLVSNHD